MRRSWIRSPLWPPAPFWLGRCRYNVTSRDRSHGLPALSHVWHHIKLSDVSLGTRPRYSLVVDEDVKKPSKQNHREFHYDTVALLFGCMANSFSSSLSNVICHRYLPSTPHRCRPYLSILFSAASLDTR